MRGILRWDRRAIRYHMGWYWISQTRYPDYGPNIMIIRRGPNAYARALRLWGRSSWRGCSGRASSPTGG